MTQSSARNTQTHASSSALYSCQETFTVNTSFWEVVHTKSSMTLEHTTFTRALAKDSLKKIVYILLNGERALNHQCQTGFHSHFIRYLALTTTSIVLAMWTCVYVFLTSTPFVLWHSRSRSPNDISISSLTILLSFTSSVGFYSANSLC